MSLTKVSYSMINGAPVSVKDFGAVGDGVTDDTTAIQAAIQAADNVFFPQGTYILGNSVLDRSVRLVGAGRGATIIKWKAASASANLLNFSSANALRVEVADLTIDGNKDNQTDTTSYYAAINLAAAGGSILALRDCRFINGRIQDVVINNQQSTPSYFYMAGCEFVNGLEGTATRAASFVQARDNVYCTWIGNRAEMPSGMTYGRAGFLLQRATASTALTFGRLVAHGNHFLNVGRNLIDTLGCIDAYGGGDLISIVGNTSKGSLGRFIDVKADCGDIVIQGNVCSDHDGTSPAIVFFGQLSPYSATSVGRNLIIANNIIRTVQQAIGKGIVVDGFDTNSGNNFTNVIVSGNIVDTVQQYGIYCYRIRNVSIIDNKIVDCARGIFVDNYDGVIEIKGNSIKGATNSGVVFTGPGVLTADVNIQNNTLEGTVGSAIGLFNQVNSFIVKGNVSRGFPAFLQSTGATGSGVVVDNDAQGMTTTWLKSGSYGSLDWNGNRTTVALGFSDRVLTIATGAITIFTDWHFVDTEASAATDDLVTINGGYDGRRLILFAANNGRDVVLKDGTGNLQLAGDFTLTHSADIIELIYRGTTWYEVSRSDNT